MDAFHNFETFSYTNIISKANILQELETNINRSSILLVAKSLVNCIGAFVIFNIIGYYFNDFVFSLVFTVIIVRSDAMLFLFQSTKIFLGKIEV